VPCATALECDVLERDESAEALALLKTGGCIQENVDTTTSHTTKTLIRFYIPHETLLV
jgi:hypothetical protein